MRERVTNKQQWCKRLRRVHQKFRIVVALRPERDAGKKHLPLFHERLAALRISWNFYSLRCPELRQNLDKLCSKKDLDKHGDTQSLAWFTAGSGGIHRGSLPAAQTEPVRWPWTYTYSIHLRLHAGPRRPCFLGSSPSSRALPT
jgi:hypothetical protein